MFDRTIAIENYWARVVGDTGEFQQIAIAENPELNDLLGCIKRILQDAFINDATEYGVSRWEAILGLSPSYLATLEERKIAILTFLSVRRPYTMRVLQSMLDATLGEGKSKINIVNDTQTLNITVTPPPNLKITVNESTITFDDDGFVRVDMSWNCVVPTTYWRNEIPNSKHVGNSTNSTWHTKWEVSSVFTVYATDSDGNENTVEIAITGKKADDGTYNVTVQHAVVDYVNATQSDMSDVRNLIHRVMPQNLVLDLGDEQPNLKITADEPVIVDADSRICATLSWTCNEETTYQVDSGSKTTGNSVTWCLLKEEQTKYVIVCASDSKGNETTIKFKLVITKDDDGNYAMTVTHYVCDYVNV